MHDFENRPAGVSFRQEAQELSPERVLARGIDGFIKGGSGT